MHNTVPFLKTNEVKEILKNDKNVFSTISLFLKNTFSKKENNRINVEDIFLNKKGIKTNKLEEFIKSEVEINDDSLLAEVINILFTEKDKDGLRYSKLMVHYFSKEHTLIKTLLKDDIKTLNRFPEFFIATDWPDYGTPEIKEDMVFPLHFESFYLIKRLMEEDLEGKQILDIGTGSGIFKIFIDKLNLDDTTVFATDINERALLFSRFNYKINFPDIEKVEGFHNHIKFKDKNKEDNFDLIISNPPYEPVPFNADYYLHSIGGITGLDVLKRFLEYSEYHLKDEGKVIFVAFTKGIELNDNEIKFEISEGELKDLKISKINYVKDGKDLREFLQRFRYFRFKNIEELYYEINQKIYDKLYLAVVEYGKNVDESDRFGIEKDIFDQTIQWDFPISWGRPFGIPETVLLFQPPLQSYFEQETLYKDANRIFTFPYGLATLASYLKTKENISYDFLVIDMDYELYLLEDFENKNKDEKKKKYKEIIESFIQIFSPSFVGFYVFTQQADLVKEFIVKIKRIDRDIKVICGGPHVQFDIQNFLKSEADFVVAGDGEIALEKILTNDIELKNQPNIFVNGSKEKEFDFSRLEKDELDKIRLIVAGKYYLPKVDFSLFERNYLVRANISILTARGCPYNKCKFCLAKKVIGNNLSFKNIDDIVDEIVNLYFVGYKEIFIWDEEFFFSERIINVFTHPKLKNLDLNYAIQTRLSQINEEFIRKCNQYSVSYVVLGIESFSINALVENAKIINESEYKKFYDNFDRLVLLLNKNNIKVGLFFLFGLPGSEIEKDKETLKKIEELVTKGSKIIHYFELSILVPYPGTEVFNSNKILIHSDISYEYYNRYGKPVFDIIQPTTKKILYSSEEIFNNWEKANEYLQKNAYINLDAIAGRYNILDKYSQIKKENLFISELGLLNKNIDPFFLKRAFSENIERIASDLKKIFPDKFFVNFEKDNILSVFLKDGDFIELSNVSNIIQNPVLKSEDVINKISNKIEKAIKVNTKGYHLIMVSYFVKDINTSKFKELHVITPLKDVRKLAERENIKSLKDLIELKYYYVKYNSPESFKQIFENFLTGTANGNYIQSYFLFINIAEINTIFPVKSNHFINLKSVLDRDNYLVLKSFTYDAYERIGTDSLRLMQEHEKQKYIHRAAIISILVDSFAHNISAHSLAALKWWLEIRSKVLYDKRVPFETGKVKKVKSVFESNENLLAGKLKEIAKKTTKDYEDQGLSDSSNTEYYTSLMEFVQYMDDELLKDFLSYKGYKEDFPEKYSEKYQLPIPLDYSLWKFIRFLRDKAAFWSGVTRDLPFGGEVKNLYTILWNDFADNPLYLGTIAHSEKIHRLNIHIELPNLTNKTEFAIIDLSAIEYEKNLMSKVRLFFIDNKISIEWDNFNECEHYNLYYSNEPIVFDKGANSSVTKIGNIIQNKYELKNKDIPADYSIIFVLVTYEDKYGDEYPIGSSQISVPKESEKKNEYGKYALVRLGKDHNDIRKELIKEDYNVFSPGGIVGEHAFFTLTENTLRNVKHLTITKDIIENGLNLKIKISPEWLMGEALSKKNKQLLKIGVMLDHDTSLIVEDEDKEKSSVIDKLRERAAEPIVDALGKPRLGGNAQDKICASMLFNNQFISVNPDLKLKKSERDDYYYNKDKKFYWIGFKREGKEEESSRGKIMKYFYLWKGEFHKVVQSEDDFENENISRFKFVIISNNEQKDLLFKRARKEGIVRVVTLNNEENGNFDTENFSNKEKIYENWIKSFCYERKLLFLGSQKKIYDTFRELKKKERLKKYFLISNDGIRKLTEDDNLKECNMIQFAHGENRNPEKILDYRSHGALVENYYCGQEANKLGVDNFVKFYEDNDCKLSNSIEQNIRALELAEILLSDIWIFDNRIYERIPENKLEIIKNKLSLTINPEKPNRKEDDKFLNFCWEEFKETKPNPNFLVIHLSFIEALKNPNTNMSYNEEEISNFIDNELSFLKEKIKGGKFILVITTGRGRYKWQEKLRKEHSGVTIFRPIESLLSAVEDAVSFKDDFQIKYNLTKVIFGS